MPKAFTADELTAKETRLKQRADALARKHEYAAKRAAEITAQLRERQRFADAHIKYALGGAIIKIFETQPTTPRLVKAIISMAEDGVQTSGSGRDAWEVKKSEWLAKRRFGASKTLHSAEPLVLHHIPRRLRI